jgi:putative ABC transport system substrate-binding protein
VKSNDGLERKKSVGPITLILIIIGSLFLSGCRAEQSQVYRVGILSGIEFFAPTADGFKEEMAELGYVEGENITYDMQQLQVPDPEREQEIIEQFVADEVDLIFVFPTEASLSAKAATEGTDVPVLFANANIEGVDLVESVRQPGGNITGVRYPGPDLAIKRFEIMRELLPEAKRMWIPYQRGYPIVASQLEVLHPAAEAEGVTLIEAPAASPAEVEENLQALAESGDVGIDVMLMIAEPLAVNPDAFAVLGEFAAERDIPMGGATMLVDGYGTIFGVSTDQVAVGKQAAPLADKILQGTEAGTIPVVSAESFIQINYAVAQELGLTVPEGLLNLANEIIR